MWYDCKFYLYLRFLYFILDWFRQCSIFCSLFYSKFYFCLMFNIEWKKKKYHSVGTIPKSNMTRATQSVAYSLAYKFDPVTLTFDLWPWKSIGFQILLMTKFGQHPLKDVDSRVFTRMLRDKNLIRWPWTLVYDLENQQYSRLS